LLTADRAGLAAAADRVSTVSAVRGGAVKLSMGEPAGELRLTVTSPDSGKAEDAMEVEYEGAALDVGFNSRYISDILGQMKGEKVHMAFADPGSPTLIRPEGDDTVFYVLMPMRV
jgi:DNA polymerase-3 subunit beta